MTFEDSGNICLFAGFPIESLQQSKLSARKRRTCAGSPLDAADLGILGLTARAEYNGSGTDAGLWQLYDESAARP